MATLRFLVQKNCCLHFALPGTFHGSNHLGSAFVGTVGSLLVHNHSTNIGDKPSVKHLVSQLRVKVQKSKQLKNRTSINIPDVSTKPKETMVKTEENAKSVVSSGKEDVVCDQRIRGLIREAQYNNIIPELEKFYDLDCYPSRKTLEILASCFSKEGNLDGIMYIRQFCAKIYPKEYFWMMGYEHYLAEAKWKQGHYRESLDLFFKLFKIHPLRRRKICNMTNFLMRHLFEKSMEAEYEHLTNFARECASLNNFEVASNLWRASFLSRTILGQQIGRDLMQSYPELHAYVSSKFPGLIAAAYERNDIDILQRLVQTALEAQLKKSYSLLLGALLNFQCQVEDIKGAMETFQYSTREKVLLPADTVQLFMGLLSQQKKKVPSELLDSKYKLPKFNRFEFKW